MMLSVSTIDSLAELIETDCTAVFVSVVDTFQSLLTSYEGAFDMIVAGKDIVPAIFDAANTLHADNVLAGRAIARFVYTILD